MKLFKKNQRQFIFLKIFANVELRAKTIFKRTSLIHALRNVCDLKREVRFTVRCMEFATIPGVWVIYYPYIPLLDKYLSQ